MIEEEGHEKWRRIGEYVDALEWAMGNEGAITDDILKAFVSMMKKRIEEQEKNEAEARVIS